MTTGISEGLQTQYSDRQWRLLTHPRSLAKGTYQRNGSFAPNIPLQGHKGMASKGFELVSIDNPADGLSGVWTELVD